MIASVLETPWQEQVAYYRQRAAEYDRMSYADVQQAGQRISALVSQLGWHRRSASPARTGWSARLGRQMPREARDPSSDRMRA
jgi:hypothetical protein